MSIKQPHIENWKAQMRKGYLDLCLLLLVQNQKRVYGLEIIEFLKNRLDLPVKEGTLYPLLSRLTADGLLESIWETENDSGHPRKFYSLTPSGKEAILEMVKEFDKMVAICATLKRSHDE